MENRLKGLVAGAVGTVAAALTGAGATAQDGGGGVLDLRDRLLGGGDTGGDTGGDIGGNDTAAAGNGGTADASANGGAVAVGDINSGGNSGGAISVGDVGGGSELVCDKYGKCYYVDNDGGAVAIDGGDVTTSTSVGISADGGVAIADASGGDNNFAFVS